MVERVGNSCKGGGEVAMDRWRGEVEENEQEGGLGGKVDCLTGGSIINGCGLFWWIRGVLGFWLCWVWICLVGFIIKRVRLY